MTTVREHPSLEAQLEQIEKVVIAPPVVKVTLITFDGNNKRLHDEEQRIRQELIRVAERELIEHRFDVVGFDFEGAIKSDDEFAFAVEQVREAYSEASKTLYKNQVVTEEDKRKFKTSVGDVVNMIADKTDADAVLIMEYNGIKKSSGKIAQEAAAGVLLGLLTGYVAVPAAMGSAVEVALVDGSTGDVLWTNVAQGMQLDAKSAELAMDKFPEDVDPVTSASVPSASVTPALANRDLRKHSTSLAVRAH